MDGCLIVTTVPDAAQSEVLKAKQLAEELQVHYIQRTGTVSKMRQRLGAERVLVVGERVTFHANGQKVFFHPSMAVVRVKRMKLGDTDVVVEKSGVLPGDTVLDCTLGMGADAIVFAHAVGEKGKIVGIEHNPVLAVLVREGLRTWHSDVPEVNDAMRRVQVVTGNHVAYMKDLPDHSVDVVYFDPMFRSTIKESSNFDPVRILSKADALTLDSMEEAKRIARRSIVLKERISSGEFQRLGFPPPHRRSSAFTYSVIRVQREE